MGDIKYIILGMVIGAIPLVIYYFLTTPKTSILGKNIVTTSTPSASSTPSLSPSPTITASPTPTSSPTPTKTLKPIVTPSPTPPSEVNALIDRFSAQYAVDANVLRHIAICESGFTPNAVNGNYVGLFQFGPTTWKNLRKEIGEAIDINLRFSAEESAQTAAYALSQGKRGIWPNCAP
jgi:hypothetical protein